MDRELTFNEVVELAKQPANQVRGELLQDLANSLTRLTNASLLLPSELHDTVKIEDLDAIAVALRHGRLELFVDLDDFLFWNNLGRAGVKSTVSTREAGLPPAAGLWEILEVHEATAAVFESMGFTPDDYLACIGTNLMSGGNLLRWAESTIPTKDIRSWVMAGVPSPSIAIHWMHELRETPELAMISYRSFAGNIDRAKSWRQRAAAEMQAWISVPSSLPVSDGRPAVLTRLDVSVLPVVGLPSKSHVWLEEIVARARTVKPSIRRVPHWPARIEFEEDNLMIQLEQLPRVIQGVVVVGRQRRSCEFNPSTFEIVSQCDTGEDRYVVGMSISWFIDCSITIHRTSHESSKLFTIASSASPRSQTQRIRYIPTPTFHERIREVRRAGAGPIIRHKVSGHIRKLPPGRRGSKQAHSNAPQHIRRNMSPSETYVEPHFRGTEAEKKELFTRLSRFSALGEAMSDLNWR